MDSSYLYKNMNIGKYDLRMSILDAIGIHICEFMNNFWPNLATVKICVTAELRLDRRVPTATNGLRKKSNRRC